MTGAVFAGEIRTPVAMLAFLTLAFSACASTPESRARDEVWGDIYWTTARACKSQFTNFAVDTVGADGSLGLKGHISTGIAEFRQCYWDGVAAKIAQRRAAGLSVPEWVNPHPAVDIDTD